MKKRQIYWIANPVTPLHHEKARLFATYDFEVEFHGNIDSLLREFEHNRAAIVVLSDHGTREEMHHTINKLASMPELSGVRLILSLSQPDSESIERAFISGFRDIIALDLDAKQWLKRFIFSTSSVPTQMSPPHPMMSLNAISAVNLPARLIWISPSRIRLETRMAPAPGTVINLGGALPEYLGLKTLTLTVLEHQKSNLKYRFSDAIVCRWNLPEALAGKRSLLLEHFRKTDTGGACRVFAAIQNPQMRSQFLSMLKAPRFEIAIALNKKSIGEEPKFFSPHIVFIEDQLCTPTNHDHLQEMARHIDLKVPIVVIGDGVNLAPIRQLMLGRQVLALPRLRATLPRLILERYITSEKVFLASDEPADSYAVPASSDFSVGEIKLPARLVQIHPLAAQLMVPVYLGNFGLCRIEAPFLTKLLNRSVYAKITDTYKDARKHVTEFGFHINCALVNVLRDDRKIIAGRMIELMGQHLAKTYGGEEQELMESVAAAVLPPKPAAAEQPHKEGEIGEIFEKLAASSKRVTEQIDVKETLVRIRPVMLFLAVTVVIFSVLGFITWQVVPRYQKSGQGYTDRLKEFQKITTPAE